MLSLVGVSELRRAIPRNGDGGESALLLLRYASSIARCKADGRADGRVASSSGDAASLRRAMRDAWSWWCCRRR